MKRGSIIYIITILITVFLIFLVPLIGIFNDHASAYLHSLFRPFCHQYAYRSLCIQKEMPFITNCLKPSENATAYLFINSKVMVKNISFSKSDIGIVRPYKIKTDKVKYVFPVCARDTGFYVGLLIGIIIFRKKNIKISIPLYILFIIPFLADGMLQLIFNYESSNMTRILTGLVAGSATSIVVLDGLER